MNRDWKKTLLLSRENIASAVETLNLSEMHIVLVVDDNSRLLGTVTDGDIRRAMADGYSMQSCVTEIMEKTPTTINQGDERSRALQLMREKALLGLPVVNSEGNVVGLEVMQDYAFGSPRANSVLLMAGGFGRRLYPLTRDVPKSLLKVGNKPILEIIVEQITKAGFSKFFLSVHYKAEQVRKHFGDGRRWGVAIEYLDEKDPLGTAGALGLLDADEIKTPLLMMNGDLLTQLDFGQLVDYHVSQGGVATMCVREYEFQIPYGVVQGDGTQVQDITEKPVQKFFVNAGIYVLEPELVAQCKGGQAKDMPDLLRTTVRSGGKVNMFPIHEYWLDIGMMEEYQRAQVEGPGA